MKKVELRKILLHYSFRQHNEEKKGWATVNTIKRPSYKEAATLLKRSLHSKPATKEIEVIKIIHLFDGVL